MLDYMLASTGNSTCIHFGFNNMCLKHNRLFTLEHVEACDCLQGVQDIRKYANKLRDEHILSWSSDERLKGIAVFALLTL